MIKIRSIVTIVVILAISLFLSIGCQNSSWNEFKPPDGSFSVSMPSIPTYAKQTENRSIGPIDLNTYSLQKNDIYYSVAYYDYPDSYIQQSAPDKILDDARDGEIAGLQGKLQIEQFITLDNFPGRQEKIETPDGKDVIQSRMYLVGHRMFVILTDTNNENALSGDINKYLDSFNLLSK